MSATAAPPKNKIGLFGQLQRIGKALMVPVAILPAAGLLLGIGAGMKNAYIQIDDPADGKVPPGLFNTIAERHGGCRRHHLRQPRTAVRDRRRDRLDRRRGRGRPGRAPSGSS